ncbi:hypothetical protein B0H19DRAFT_1249177 [Mycena capillaripes]|nr:hypothetical protein B0H19DRAFT_1249177 [Mycena capillaripes]
MHFSASFILLSLVSLVSAVTVSKDKGLSRRGCIDACGIGFDSCTSNGGSNCSGSLQACVTGCARCSRDVEGRTSGGFC